MAMNQQPPPRYLYWFFPNPNRYHPRSWTDWARLGALMVVLLLIATGVSGVGGQVIKSIECRDGLPSADIWESGGECVGLTEGPYAFDLDALAPVMRVIAKQNEVAAEQCDPKGTPVTVGVLLTMTDEFAGSRAVHELEGMAAGQRVANGTGCLHPVKLVVGQVGRYGEAPEPTEIARLLAERPDVVAVAGIGLSHQRSAEVADVLAAARIPIVSDLITAEGFDQSGSRDDQPVFGGCDAAITYPRGIGKDYFYRVAFRSTAQLDRLGEVTTARPDFIMVPTGGSDPYTCTTLPLMQRRLGGNITEVKFETEDASTVLQTARRVCGAAKDVTVGYIARGRDLGMFLYGLDQAFSSGQCAASSITVVSTSDANRLRAPETDPRLEDLRIRALTSGSFTSGKVRLISTLVAGADGPRPDNPRFVDFEKAFTEAGFDIAHIDTGWAVNAYDALTTIATALGTLPASRPVNRGQINTAISGFSSAEQAVPGAGGPITFDNSGNRTGGGPPVVRICPLPSWSGDEPSRTTSAAVLPGQPATGCGP